MFLKSLTLKGFKSFADPTTLELEPGITVVVGPNGSGKSNVVDAVTWVLGAQGTRSLRSQKMEDVIFAGTTQRPALGRAEVLLTIDNASGRLPVDMAEVTISRTLFRSGDSEYAINGAPCRLLDVQELLSDSGVGRSQHMIIGQGQLDTILNSRPEDRRAVIEEAAGVLKHRRRRERAERRLDATGENLERLGDLVREVRRQIRPLERQAAAARSAATLAGDVRALRLYLAGRELTSLGERAAAAREQLARLGDEETKLATRLEELDAAAASANAALSARREEDLATELGRVRALVERAKGTRAVVRERERSVEAALDAAADVDVVSTLEADSARLSSDLATVDSELAALRDEDLEIAQAESALGPEPSSNDHPERAEIEATLNATRARDDLLATLMAEHETTSARLADDAAAAEVRFHQLGEQFAEGEKELVDQRERQRLLESELTAAQIRHRDAKAATESAEGHVRTADAAAHRAQAAAESLADALAQLRQSPARSLLAGAAGVLGALDDLLEIDTGWEQSIAAALGAAMSATVVGTKQGTRDVLDRLEAAATAGVVISTAIVGDVAPGSGLGGFGRGNAPLPAGVDELRHHVRPAPGAPVELSSLLDVLLAAAVRVDSLDGAAQIAITRPDLVVVTPRGDRLAAGGWSLHPEGTDVTREALHEAQARAVQAQAASEAATATLAAARHELETARQHEQEIVATLEHVRASSAGRIAAQERLGREIERVGADLEALTVRLSDLHATLEAERAESTEVSAARAQLEVRWSALEAQLDTWAQTLAAARQERDILRQRRAEFDRRQATAAERRRVLEGRLAEVERRLSGHGDARIEAAARRVQLEFHRRSLSRLDELISREQQRTTRVMAALQVDYRDQMDAFRATSEQLEAVRKERSETEHQLAQLRDHNRKADIEASEVSLRTGALLEHIGRDLGTDAETIMAMECPEFSSPEAAAADASRMEEELSSLGPVNPLALEELSALEERHRELDTQVSDVRDARRELQSVIRALDEEIISSFTAAAADVNEHFSTLVATLFPGGTGRLALTEPDDLLNTGVEIEMKPAGRNVRRVSLLSGGERSLVALAFLFAVFRSRPSPFYLMDEVEAALDDVNLHRFLDLVRQFRSEAQLIIVSHQKRTMETGDALYGVTMAPGGSSKVVSQKVDRPSSDEPPAPPPAYASATNQLDEPA